MLDCSRCNILVVGDVMLDRYWHGHVDRISPEAPVPVVHVARQEDRPGGAANVARNVAALGARTTLLSIVGPDAAAGALLSQLEQAGVQADLQVDSSLETTMKLRILGRQQQLLRVDFENRPLADSLDALRTSFAAHLPGTDLVIFSDYNKGTLENISAMIQMARAADVPTLVDPKGTAWHRYSGATVITPNLSELKAVAGPWANEAELGDRVRELRLIHKFMAVLLTRSEEGMSFYGDDEAHVGTRAKEVFDVTGAGDTAIATLGVMRAAGLAWIDAMHLANTAAGVAVGKLGTAVVTPEELDAAA